MENVTQAVNDELVISLDYKLGSSNVNYIQSRRSTSAALCPAAPLRWAFR